MTNSRSVLVVEDEHLTRFSIAESLREHGFKVLEAVTADAGHAVLLTETPIDVVFTDIQTPGKLDGLALAAWIREHRPTTRVLVASGLPSLADRARSVCDPTSIFDKPYDAETIIAYIETLFV